VPQEGTISTGFLPTASERVPSMVSMGRWSGNGHQEVGRVCTSVLHLKIMIMYKFGHK
jgi:hypothetical protein